MNIILGKHNADQLNSKHVVLELDTFRYKENSDPVTAYCVTEDLSIESLMRADEMRSLHEGLIRNYRKKNWQYCIQAIEHLRGQWDGQVDSFYDTMLHRISNLQSDDLPQDWDGVIDKS